MHCGAAVLRGALCAWRAGDAAHLEYEGFVHRVESAALVIIFASSFHKNHAEGAVVNVACAQCPAGKYKAGIGPAKCEESHRTTG